MVSKNLYILGTRGIPASHGGFETFANELAIFLKNRGWNVIVYCQVNSGNKIVEENWKKIKLIKIPVNFSGSLGTIIFDIKSIFHAKKMNDCIYLTLGYNTAIFNFLLNKKKSINIMNMDGIEWKRRKYNFLEKLWLYINERAGYYICDHLIADNPNIKKHLQRKNKEKKIDMIPYGAKKTTISFKKEQSILRKLKIKKPYALVVARPVDENNIFEIVKTFSHLKEKLNLIVLGNYSIEDKYQKKVLKIATTNVIFLGAIYEKDKLSTLRNNALIYIHGHSVGGTNPALVEAMSYGIPIFAHNNLFNKWVAGDESKFFNNEIELKDQISLILGNELVLEKMSKSSFERHQKFFRWSSILESYNKLFSQYTK